MSVKVAEFTLKSFAESGNCYKVALMLELCGADWQPEKVDFFDGETRSDEFRADNVMGEAPILTHHKEDGSLSLTQSGVILTYLSRHFDRFGPADEMDGYEVLRWILFDNHKLTGYTGTARFLRVLMNKPDDPATQFLHGRALNAYKVLEAHLAGRDWVVGDAPTIADLSLCGYLFWPEHMGVDWADYPNIQRWLANIQALDGWKRPEELMPAALKN